MVFAKNSGLKICTLSEHAQNNIFETNLKEPSVLVLGSEKEGVSNKIINISNELIKIPTKGDIISLNVSVAAGIILSELQRQRNLN